MFFSDALARLKVGDSQTASGISETWIRNIQTWVRAITPIPGPYADDAAAALAGIVVGQVYTRSDGNAYTRLT